jgi:hypothetical protein
MSGQIGGMAGGDAGHVAETTSREPQQCGVLLVATRRDVHERGRRELGTWLTTATSASWWSGIHRDHLGAEAAPRGPCTIS